jgi:hypothetical protein
MACCNTLNGIRCQNREEVKLESKGTLMQTQGVCMDHARQAVNAGYFNYRIVPLNAVNRFQP